MSFTTLILLQLLAHILADYFLQSDRMAISKNALGFKSRFLALHIAIVFFLSWALSFQLKFIFAATVIALLHYIIDGCKPFITKLKYVGVHSFFIDQIAHIAVLLIVTGLYAKYYGIQYINEFPVSPYIIGLILAYLCCLKPANIIIREVLLISKIQVNSSDELPNGGRIIGNLERLLVLTFILVNHWEAIGFLIAAKSILRYKDTDTLKTEYVLIGTMLSFGSALFLGIVVKFIL
jgi:hypothetical protein